MTRSSTNSSADTVTDVLSFDWTLSLLRWPWLAVALLIVWLNPEPLPQTLPYVYFVIGIGAMLNLAHMIALYLQWHPKWVRLLGIALDTGIVIALLVMTGGWRSPMLPVAIFPVLAASLCLGIEGGLMTAVPIVLVYGGSAALAWTPNSLETLYPVGLNILLLLGVACVAGLLPQRQESQAGEPVSEELETLRRANQRAKVIREMATTLSATLDYTRVLRTMLDLSLIALNEEGQLDVSPVGLVMLFEREENFEELRVYAGRNIPRHDENRVVSGRSGLIARAVNTAELLITEEASSDPVLSQLSCMRDARSAVCVPLRAGFDIFGVVVLASPEHGCFHAEYGELLSTFCHQASLALKNALLYQELQREQRRILEKEAESRQKLARELHDGPAQTISAIAMRLNFARMMTEKNQPRQKIAEEIQQIEELSRKTTQQVRTMLFTLRPVVLETRGLVAGLRQYAERLRKTDTLNVQVEAGGYGGQLGKEAEGVVFSIVEEAVGNARKHANANLIAVHLAVAKGIFSVEIRDDGAGFDAQGARGRPEAGHMGLLNMEDRAQYLGGQFSIESQPGAGTTVRVDIPLRQRSADRGGVDN
jgi:signal transduction histidine kinase